MFNFLKTGLRKFIGEENLYSNSISGLTGFINDSDSILDQVALKKYKTSLLVFTCMNKIATVVASADFDLFKVLNTKGEVEKQDVHEIIDILYRPNSLQTKTEFMRIMAINLTLSGETFLKIIRDDKGKIIGLINVRPDIVDVIYKNDVIKYSVNYGTKKEEFDNTQMIHIKTPDPDNMLRGVGVLTPILNRITAEQKGILLQNILFTNQGRPDGILWVKNAKTDNSVKEAKAMWRNSFSDKESDSRVAIIGGLESDFKYQQVSFSQQDMQMIENMKHLRDDVAMAFGVPKSLLTSDDVNLANAETGYKQFVNFTIKPLLVLFEESMNERFVEPFWDEALYIKHVELVTEDRKMLLDELTQGIDKWITINEARQKTGLEPIGEAGDKLFRTFGTVDVSELSIDATITPVQQNAFRGRPYLYKKLKAKEDLINKVADSIYSKMSGIDLFSDVNFKKQYVNLIHRATDRNIKEFDDAMSDFFTEQGTRTIKALKDLSDSETLTTEKIFPKTVEKKEAKTLAMKKYPKMALRAGNAGLVPVKMFKAKSDDFEIDEEVIKMLNGRALLFAESITLTTFNRINDIIVAGIEEGVGRDVMARRLRKTFTDMSTVRARTIAQTEGTVVSNIGLKESFRQSDSVVGEKWLSAGDDKVRDEHRANEAQGVLPKGSTWTSGESYPGQDSVNCRCVIAPSIKLN